MRERAVYRAVMLGCAQAPRLPPFMGLLCTGSGAVRAQAAELRAVRAARAACLQGREQLRSRRDEAGA